MQVSVHGQVGASQRLHESLPQTVLLSQQFLHMIPEHLQHLEPLSCRTQKHLFRGGVAQNKVWSEGWFKNIDPSNVMMTSPGLTEVEAVGDIGALLVDLQQLQPQPHLHEQEANRKQTPLR